MKITHNISVGRLMRPLMPLPIGAVATHFVGIPCVEAADPPRMRHADALLGIHFDFHAGEDYNRVGERTISETVELVIKSAPYEGSTRRMMKFEGNLQDY
jgi:hypothetical protein